MPSSIVKETCGLNILQKCMFSHFVDIANSISIKNNINEDEDAEGNTIGRCYDEVGDLQSSSSSSHVLHRHVDTHLSLSRVFSLKSHQIESFIANLNIEMKKFFSSNNNSNCSSLPPSR